MKGPIRSGTALLATIDDHEVTNDFSGGAPRESDPRFAEQSGALISDTEWFNNGLQAFQEYNPLRNETYGATGEARTANRRKLYRYRTFGNDAAVFVLDCRSFRDQPIPPVDALDLESALSFLRASFQPGRTFLWRPQLEDLKRDLLAAQQNRITWKFILVPEPIQNLGPLNGQDRFEGYADERSELLKFIKENAIKNVVFVAADIHGTLVNNVSDTLAELELDYPPLGLEDSAIQATLVSGDYVAVMTYGWTEFRVDAATQQLRVITYGIEPYTRAEMEADPDTIQARTPEVVSEFTVDPQPLGDARVLLPIVSSPAAE